MAARRRPIARLASAAVLLAGAGLLLTSATAGAGDIPGPKLAESKFNSSLGGWKVIGDPAPGWPQWTADNGGLARTVDGGTGETMYWKAPRKFLGDKRDAFKGTLRFQLRQSSLDNQFDDDDVKLKGDGLELIADFPGGPAIGGFSGHVEDMVPSNWEKPDGSNPSRKRFKRVLKDVDRLLIRAEYRLGFDTDDIDNVGLFEQGPPG